MTRIVRTSGSYSAGILTSTSSQRTTRHHTLNLITLEFYLYSVAARWLSYFYNNYLSILLMTGVVRKRIFLSDSVINDAVKLCPGA